MIKITFEDTVGEMKDKIEKYLKDNADNPTVMQIYNQRMSHAVYGATSAPDEKFDSIVKEAADRVSKNEEDNKKAIECTISISDYNNDNTLLVFKFKIDGTYSTKSLSKIATNTKEFIRYLKQYTDGHTKFIDERVGSSWIAFYSRISYDCNIIEMDADNITLTHYDHSNGIKHYDQNGTIGISYKTERKYFEDVLDQIKDTSIIYIRDETA